MSLLSTAPAHADLMNATYRHQRFVYDATRKYFLLGRDHLIESLDPPAGGHVLEIACGTGRNLAQIAKRHPDCRLYGLDISAEMLRSAHAKLGERALLAEADACGFDARQSFGIDRFDRIVLSYCLSMIPDWTGALRTAMDRLAPQGQVHVVDFGDQAGLPAWFRTGLLNWLARFHVEPRDTFRTEVQRIAVHCGADAEWRSLCRGYAQYASLSKP